MAGISTGSREGMNFCRGTGDLRAKGHRPSAMTDVD